MGEVDVCDGPSIGDSNAQYAEEHIQDMCLYP